MATTTLTVNPQLITVDGTEEHQIDWTSMLRADEYHCTALVTLVTGTAVQFNSKGSVTSASAGIKTADNKFVLTLYKNDGNIYYKGGAGSETFSITITS